MDMMDKYDKSVELVHRTLEILKYFGGKREERCTGEGIDVNIVLMADLLLDFRTEYLDDPNKKTCTVGGRAARIACALMHLQSQEDELFQCYLITKTGDQGFVLLSNEFKGTAAEAIFESKFRDYIIHGDRETRCALMYHGQGEGSIIFPSDKAASVSDLPLWIRSSKQSKENELSIKDLKSYPLDMQVIKYASVLYFSSLKHPNFMELLEHIIDKPEGYTGPKIFLDLTRVETSKQPDGKAIMGELTKYLKGIESRERSKIFAGLLVPDKTKEFFYINSGESELAELAQYLNLPIVSYGTEEKVGYIQVYDVSKKGIVDVSKDDLDFDHEGVPERFKAGVLLAYATQEALGNIATANRECYNILRRDWGAMEDGEETEEAQRKKCWENIIQYGVSLASRPELRATREHSGMHELFLKISEKEMDFTHYQRSLRGTNTDLNISMLTVGSLTNLNHPNDIQQHACLAGYRRVKLFRRFSGDYPFLCKKENLRCLDKKCKQRQNLPNADGSRKQKRKKRIRAAILLDLDSTLLNSTLQRHRCLRYVMRHLLKDKDIGGKIRYRIAKVEDLGKRNPDERLVELLEKRIYDMTPLYHKFEENDFQLGDFRQQWNSEGWYVTLLVLLFNEDMCKWISDIESEARRGDGRINTEFILNFRLM